MHPTRRRLVGTIALTIPISTFLIRGLLRDDDIPLVLLLGGVAIIATTVYRMWPGFEYIWELRPPPPLTWARVAAAAGVVLLLTVAFVLGGQWFGLDLDPWLVLAGLALTAKLTWSNWQDATIRLRAGE
jgi:hypothetical protein